jgi:hypothetical protein
MPRRFSPPWMSSNRSERPLTNKPNLKEHKAVQAAPKSGPTFKSVAAICVSILRGSDVGGFPWSNSFDYDSDSGQYISDLTLHTPGFGFQEFLQLLEFGD